MKMTTQKRALDKIYKRRDRYQIPDWQREEVWGLGKRQKLIDSILRGWRLPKFYFLKTSTSEYEVVDGQQRLAAIYSFLDGELQLPASSEVEYGGRTYSDLSETYSDAFDDFEIDIDEIEDASDDEIRDFFQRLQEGFPLSSSEKLNSVNSKLRNFAKQITGHKFFTIIVPFKNTRYAHFDVAAKSLAIEIEGLDAGLRYDDLKTTYETNKAFSTTSKVAKRIMKSLDFLSLAIPPHAAILRSRSLTQSMITLACRLMENGATDSDANAFGRFAEKFASDLSRQVELGHDATDPGMLQFQRTINANVRTGPKTRHTILLRKLFEYDPHFTEHFDTLAIKLSGTDKEINRLASSIQILVADINTAESSLNGADMFKATNKTVKAINIISKPAENYEEYKVLIENLYFLFWEGPGSKLDGAEPTSFKDINSLRTALEHDVDHGAQGKVKKKNKDLGKVFHSYSGVTSPVVAAPELFPIVHVKLLGKLESDLMTMKKGYATSGK